MVSAVFAQAPTQPALPRPIDIPPWFTQSFLDLHDELQAAAQEKKRLLLYFGQDGCPYCRRLMEVNFSQRTIVDKTRANFRAVALDIWGDLDVTWTDRRRTTEKQLAKQLNVQFTPTLLFLDEQGRVEARLNGYWPPHRFEAALDYLITRQSSRLTLAEYLERNAREAARDELNSEPFLMKAPFDLRRKAGGKPLAVLFETRSCRACDEMHAEGFQRPEMRALIARFDIARFALNDASEAHHAVGGPARRVVVGARAEGESTRPPWCSSTPATAEVFRFEGYLRPFHLTGAFDYVAQGAYRTQPEFQRFLQSKAERLREQGQVVDLWR